MRRGLPHGVQFEQPQEAYDEPGPEVRDHRDEEPALPPGDSNDEDAIVRDHRDGPLDDFHARTSCGPARPCWSS